ncbi:MAG: glucosidase family protein, partial [Candidatus Aminicenantales bacterium]
WGDIGLEDADQTAIYTDADTHWTADIYDQSMFFAAARALAVMLRSAGRSGRAEFWTLRARDVRAAADRLLWQENLGFYRVHLHLDSLVHPFNEDDMFALGGNTEAILSGLAGPDKAVRIIRTALARQADFRMPTIGASLLPPYPKGTFKHPMADDPYEYQNGGQWDWFAGKMIRAMFDHGFSKTARAKLLEIARKDVAAGGLFEWDGPDGRGRGSAAFCGSAGSLASAVAEGYFGIRLNRDGCDLEPRLAGDGAKVFFRLPAAGVSVSYDYAWDPVRNQITFRYESSTGRPGRIRLLLPEAIEAAELDVRRDGRSQPFTIERLGEDTLLVSETDFAFHTLVIRGRNQSKGKSRP